MKYKTTLLIPFLSFVLFSTVSVAQVYTTTNTYRVSSTDPQYYSRKYSQQDGYSSRMMILLSDFSTKSVLVSSVKENVAGDMSPVIGAATWNDNGNLLQCRSLLEFDYSPLPAAVLSNPWLITSAELILYPVDVAFSPNDLDKPCNLLVRRVLENWEDFSTGWINQPFTDQSLEVSKIIKQKNKNKAVEVDVTDFVKEMIAFENNGFMIYNDNDPKPSMASGQLFSSPKNEDPDLRPQLVIKYKDLNRYRREIENYYYLYGGSVNYNLQQTGRDVRMPNREIEAPTKQISTGTSSTSAPVIYTAPIRTPKPPVISETNNAPTRTTKPTTVPKTNNN